MLNKYLSFFRGIKVIKLYACVWHEYIAPYLFFNLWLVDSRMQTREKFIKKFKTKLADNLRDVDAINADRAFKLPR